jgi:hypothetical protein
MDRKMFLKVLVGAGASLPCLSINAIDETGKCKDTTCTSDSNAVRYFLTQFLIKEENNDKMCLLRESRASSDV